MKQRAKTERECSCGRQYGCFILAEISECHQIRPNIFPVPFVVEQKAGKKHARP